MDYSNLECPKCEVCGSQNLKSLLPRATCAKHEGKTLIGTCETCIVAETGCEILRRINLSSGPTIKKAKFGCIHWK